MKKGVAFIKVLLRDRDGNLTDITDLVYSKIRGK